MMMLIAGLLLFLGVHSIRIVADDWRTRQIQSWGQLRWKGMYALISAAGLLLIVAGFAEARVASPLLWVAPGWIRHLTALLMLAAFILLAAAYIPGNRIKSRLGHPMLLATKTWAIAHLLANGRLADVVLFGAFLLWAAADCSVSRRRDRAAGTRYPAQGVSRDMLVAIVGLAAYALFALFVHEWLTGLRPFH